MLAAERLHGDDTTVPVLAKGKTITGRLWAYVRDDRPFGQGQTGPPAVLFHYSRDRRGEHPRSCIWPDYAGILQADAYSGFAGLYAPTRAGGAVTEALCWAHARRKLLRARRPRPRRQGRRRHRSPSRRSARSTRSSPTSATINGRAAADRLAYRREHAAPLVGDLEAWMKSERAKLSRHADVARAMDYMLKRWPAFTRFLDDGRICLTNNAAERALRGVALGRKSWLFVGSDRGGLRAAVMYTLIGTARCGWPPRCKGQRWC